jgi:hypothetical protein
MAPNTRAAANWATSRAVALVELGALVAGVCMLLLWQTIKCTYRCVARSTASRTPDSTPSSVAPTPPPNEEEADDWPISRVLALPELWAIVAEHSRVAGAWRLTGVCKAAREGARAWLRTLPGLVLCGGRHCSPWNVGGIGDMTSEVLRLDLGELRWERMPDLALGRANRACCAVRGRVVVLGGFVDEDQTETRRRRQRPEKDEDVTANVEIVGFNSSSSDVLPPLSCGPIHGAGALAIDESESEQGQALLIGGWSFANGGTTSAVRKFDLGVCTRQEPSLLSHPHAHTECSAARLPDGRIVCVGGYPNDSTVGWTQVLEPSERWWSPGEASWRWRFLPGMSVGRSDSKGIVLSDGRFAVFGGRDEFGTSVTSCEVLTMDGDGERWETLRPMREARAGFACAAIGGCIIVAGGGDSVSLTVEVYEETLGRWRRLPCNLPDDPDMQWTGGASM